ncbi:MAG: alpha/beta hydrolase [Anaerolineales bacterium]|nr:alpha/beta hydrolase [Anaerolineales bacterium]
MTDIPFFDYGGNGAPLHFLHANGYPPECYRPLLERLQKNYRVFGMKLRPLWKNQRKEDFPDWTTYSQDLLRLLSDLEPNPVIGVGHSIGATVTLRAAMREPQKFRALILLDPVLFVPSFMTLWNFARAIGIGDQVHPLIQGAKRRRREFDNLDVVFRSYRSKPVFRYVDDESLRAYINGIAQPKAGGGYELAYSPEWEAHIYKTGLRDYDLWRGLADFKTPTLILRGDETDTFLPPAVKLIQKRNRQIQIQTLKNATHILPIEHPEEIAESIKEFVHARHLR